MKKNLCGITAMGALASSLLFSTSTVHADIGPAPPSMEFSFEFQTQPVLIRDSLLLHCDDSTCTNARTATPAQMLCDEQSCYSIGIIEGYTPYQKIVVTFSDKTRESNPFPKIAYFAKYIVIVSNDSLFVREVFPDSPLELFSPIQVFGFLPALVLSIISETVVAALYSRRIETLVKWVGYANVLSVPIVWFVFPFLRLGALLIFFSAEIFAVGSEAMFLYVVNKKAGLSFKQASSVSLLMNISSIAVGILAAALAIGLIYMLSHGY